MIGLAALEAAAGALVAVGFTRLCMSIDVNPVQRIGQVSGLAAMQLRFILVFIVIALVWWALSRWISRPVALRVACGSLAGLASGLVAGGVAVILRGTEWPLNGTSGDSGQLQQWVFDIQHGRSISDVYPPLFPRALTWWTEVFNPDHPGAGLKMFGMVLLALSGPAVYLAWRLLLPPLWALGLGVVAVFPLVTPAKPYADIPLLILIPLLAKFVETILRAARFSAKASLLSGAVFGAAFGLLFLWYSGWFVWSAPGVLALVIVMIARVAREGRRPALLRAATVMGASAVTFLLIAGSYAIRLISNSGEPDTYMYFDTNSDPAYFVMWQGDQPGAAANGLWPPPGELGGVGVFVLLLVVGIGVALWLGSSLPVVQVAAFCMLGAFLMRYWFASHMERDQLVQLYPRTSAELLYCSIVLCAMAGYLISQKFAGRGAVDPEMPRHRLPISAPALRTSGAVLCALAFFAAMAGSSTVDRLMPSGDQNSHGAQGWTAQTTRLPNGHCPKFAPEGKCHEPKPLVR
ncbi:hypothetical protein [Kitasatospora aureofaciens]|uniref:hypothetical protein n=1 Tax=Kitasatospora aureofaciens TaxID=1894 RepID=UPI0037F95E2F